MVCGALNLLLPKHYGNEIISNKTNYLQNNKHNTFNTYFVGSSRVSTQIDARVFNKNTKKKSFNLGCPALSGFETLEIVDYLLDDPKLSTNLKHILIEFPLLSFNKGKNLHTVRGSYFFDFKALGMSIKNLNAEGAGLSRKMKKLSFQCFTAIKNWFKLGSLSSAFRNTYKTLPASTFNRYKQRLGYTPLSVSTTNESELARRRELMRDTSILTQRLRDAKKYIAKKEDLDNTNEYLLEKLEHLIAKAKSQGVSIQVMIFPKSNGIIYKKSMNVFLELPEENTINLAKPGKYSEFYFSKYSFDKAHLNEKGSTKMTKLLAEEFLLNIEELGYGD